MDDWKNAMICVFVVIPLLLLASIFDSINRRKMARCYRKKGINSACEKQKCFIACCLFQDEKWLEGLKKRAAKGDQEAVASLEFYYRYE